jgi:hypothetical protein
MFWRDERVRFGAGIVGVVIVLATFAMVVIFGLGALKWLVRDSAPVLMGWPGGPWAVGGVFGLVTVFGAVGGLWFGWLVHRWRAARAAERRVRERERMRKVRKKGKGKSRAAARRG